MSRNGSSDRVPVVFVGGSGRCGSTLLSLLFCEHPSFIDCGEIKNVWERGVLEDRKCACGDRFSKCDFWSGVLRSELSGVDEIDVGELATTSYQLTRYRNYMRLRGASHGRGGRLPEDYLVALSGLYRRISESVPGKFIVDSSKLAPYARVLMMLPNVDVFFLNLVRDPRAVVYSWRKRLAYEPGAVRQMDRFGVLHASLIWKFAYMTANDVMKDLPGLTVRYEDLVGNTAGTMKTILEAIGSWRGEALPALEIGDLTWSNVSHSMSGNPLRFRRGQGVKLDSEWKEDFKGFGAFVTTLLCRPELRRYGYAA